MKIYNSTSKSKEEFIPQERDKVFIYSCGPTVYDYPHLGHARNNIVFDLLHRILKYQSFEVNFVRNYTDIDDKIINKAKKEDKSIKQISDFYIQEDLKALKKLNILDVSSQPKATHYINKMIDMISRLLNKDIAYIIDDGVYFDVSKDSKYGEVSQRVQEDTKSRIDINQNKRNNADFSLWKFESDENISYDASFGRGRPGWHSECACMIEDIFKDNKGYFVDIHCGGYDLLFPHHENESAHIRCLSDKKIAKYWMHNGFVQIDNEKMSKSLDNSFFLKDILKDYHSEVVRFYLLSTHYRGNFNFSYDGLDESKKTLDRFYRLKKMVYDIACEEKYENQDILEALNDDMNISKAMSFVNEFVTKSYDVLLNNSNKKEIKKCKKQIKSFFVFLDELLGIGGLDAFEYFQFGLSKEKISQINNLMNKRDEYRAKKNYENSDKIKQQLEDMGITIMDTQSKSQWEIRGVKV